MKRAPPVPRRLVPPAVGFASLALACNLVAGLEEPAGGSIGTTATGLGGGVASSSTGGTGGDAGVGGCPPEEPAGPGIEQVPGGSFEDGTIGSFVEQSFGDGLAVQGQTSYCGCRAISVTSPTSGAYGELRYPLGFLAPGTYHARARLGAPDGLPVDLMMRDNGGEIGAPARFADDVFDGTVDGIRTASRTWTVAEAHDDVIFVVAMANDTGVVPQIVFLDCVSLTRET